MTNWLDFVPRLAFLKFSFAFRAYFVKSVSRFVLWLPYRARNYQWKRSSDYFLIRANVAFVSYKDSQELSKEIFRSFRCRSLNVRVKYFTFLDTFLSHLLFIEHLGFFTLGLWRSSLFDHHSITGNLAFWLQDKRTDYIWVVFNFGIFLVALRGLMVGKLCILTDLDQSFNLFWQFCSIFTSIITWNFCTPY